MNSSIRYAPVPRLWAGQIGVGGALGHDAGVGVGDGLGPVHVGLGEPHDHRVVVRGGYPVGFEAGQATRSRRGHVGVEQPLEGVHHVGGHERLAVVEGDPVAQMERPLGAVVVGLPALGQMRGGGEVLVEPDDLLGDQRLEQAVGGRCPVGRVEGVGRRGGGVIAVAQGLEGPGRGGGGGGAGLGGGWSPRWWWWSRAWWSRGAASVVVAGAAVVVAAGWAVSPLSPQAASSTEPPAIMLNLRLLSVRLTTMLPFCSLSDIGPPGMCCGWLGWLWSVVSGRRNQPSTSSTSSTLMRM